jgi:hypothetical protein
MNDIIKRGPGRPRKQPEEFMTPTETLKDLAVTIAAPEPVAAAPEKPKLYTFKVLRHTNFAQPDFEVIDVDADGKWQPPRAPTPLEYGPGTKVWAGAIINVNAARAKSFDQHSIGKRIDNYD